MDLFGLVASSAFEDEAVDCEKDEEPKACVLRYCHHCQKPIEGHQYQFMPNRFLCKKCFDYRYVLINYEERVRPGPGDRISEKKMKFE